MTEDYQLTPAQLQWSRKGKQGLSASQLKALIKKQKGLCALSGVEMLFDKEFGNPNVNSKGCHPLYAAIDHVSPSKSSLGYQIVCYDLNDLKAHLPFKIFRELQLTMAWRRLMKKWRSLAKEDRMNIHGFKKLIED